MASPNTIDVNIEIRGLPLSANRILNALARIRGTTKRIIVREALVEYANKHSGDLAMIAERQGLKGGDDAAR
jgi:predicted DNA-binding protein